MKMDAHIVGVSRMRLRHCEHTWERIKGSGVSRHSLCVTDVIVWPVRPVRGRGRQRLGWSWHEVENARIRLRMSGGNATLIDKGLASIGSLVIQVEIMNDCKNERVGLSVKGFQAVLE